MGQKHKKLVKSVNIISEFNKTNMAAVKNEYNKGCPNIVT